MPVPKESIDTQLEAHQSVHIDHRYKFVHAIDTGPDNADQFFDHNREAGKSKTTEEDWWNQFRRYPHDRAE